MGDVCDSVGKLPASSPRPGSASLHITPSSERVVEGREGYRWRHQSELEVVVEENPPLGEHDSSGVARFLALSRFKIFLTRDVLFFSRRSGENARWANRGITPNILPQESPLLRWRFREG